MISLVELSTNCLEVMNIKKLDHCILREIGVLSRSIHAIHDAKFKALDLQKGQFIFLTRICENPGINHIDLSNLLKVDKTTTTKAIQKLIKASYIRKARDPLDKRMWRLHAEKQGTEIYDQVIAEENRSISVCFTEFTAEEKESVLQLVKKMRENIERDWEQLKMYRSNDDGTKS